MPVTDSRRAPVLLLSQTADGDGKGRELATEFVAITCFVVGVVEAGSDSGSHQGETSAFFQTSALPNAARNDVLQVHAGAEIRAQGDEFAVAAGVKLEHLYRITQIEVKDLFARKAMNDRESVRREQVVDAGRKCARAAVGRESAECGIWVEDR